MKNTLAETERLLTDIDRRGFYKHLKGTVGMAGRKARSEQSIMDEDATLLRTKCAFVNGTGGFFQTLLNKRSLIFDPTISALFPQRPLTPSLGDEPV